MKEKKKKNGIFKEFTAFINKGNALALAIGVIIGSAFSAIVTAINVNIISPIIACIVGDKKLSESLVTVLKYREATEADVVSGTATSLGEKVPSIVISWGAFIQAVIDFLLIAIILFTIVKIVTSIVKHAQNVKERLQHKEEENAIPEPTPEPVVVEDPADVKLLMEIRDLLKESKEQK